jgi:cytochrome c-type biogenesis protein CcmH
MIFQLVLILFSVSLCAAMFVIAPALFSRGEAGRRPRYWSAGVAGLAVLLSGLGLYSFLGRPDHALLSLRAEPDPGNYYELVVYLARAIRERPNDIQGWTILGGAYLAFGEVDQSVAAYQRAMNLAQSQGADIPVNLVANFAVARSLQSGGVSRDLEDVFRQVLMRDPTNADARYHIGLWEPLMAEPPSGAYWRANLPFQIAGLTGEAPNAVGAATPGEGPDIRAMVEGLAERLAQQPDDIEGWTMLIRAYAVLGETENALNSLDTARAFFADNDAAQSMLSEQAQASSLNAGLAGQAPNAAAGPAMPAQGPDIRAMVDGLAARLAEQPDDIDGWMMLIRAYVVLGETENALNSLNTARAFFAGDDAAQSMLSEQAQASSLE